MRAVVRGGPARVLALLLALVLLPRAAVAEDRPAGVVSTDQEVAAAATTLFDGGRTVELATLAARARPDPWMVVERLVLAGRADVARAFGAGTRGVGNEKLPAYAQTRTLGARGRPGPRGPRGACRRGRPGASRRGA